MTLDDSSLDIILLSEFLRDLSGKLHEFSGPWMDERETLRMEGEAAERVALGFVFLVTGNGMSDPMRVCSDLVLASGFEVEFDAGVLLTVLFEMLEGAAVACGELPVLARRLVPVEALLYGVAMDLERFGMFIHP